MRLFAALVLLLFLICSSSDAQNKSERESQQGKTERQVPRASAAPCQGAVEVNISTPPNEMPRDTPKQDSKAQARPFITGGEGLVAIITIAYVVISYYSFRAIERQAQNAVNIERAWIDFKLIKQGGSYALEVTNLGRTIGKINGYTFGTRVVPFEGTIENAPDSPQEQLSRHNLNRILVPAATSVLDVFSLAEYFAKDWPPIVVHLTKKGYFFVSIHYEDAAGNRHDTDGCYTYHLGSRGFEDMPEKKKYA